MLDDLLTGVILSPTEFKLVRGFSSIKDGFFHFENYSQSEFFRELVMYPLSGIMYPNDEWPKKIPIISFMKWYILLPFHINLKMLDI